MKESINYNSSNSEFSLPYNDDNGKYDGDVKFNYTCGFAVFSFTGQFLQARSQWLQLEPPAATVSCRIKTAVANMPVPTKNIVSMLIIFPSEDVFN
jgi:hypothetical protein